MARSLDMAIDADVIADVHERRLVAGAALVPERLMAGGKHARVPRLVGRNRQLRRCLPKWGKQRVDGRRCQEDQAKNDRQYPCRAALRQHGRLERSARLGPDCGEVVGQRTHQLDRQRQIASGRRRLDSHFVRTERNVNARRQPGFAFGTAIDRQLRFRRMDENAVALAIDRRVEERDPRVR